MWRPLQVDTNKDGMLGGEELKELLNGIKHKGMGANRDRNSPRHSKFSHPHPHPHHLPDRATNVTPARLHARPDRKLHFDGEVTVTGLPARPTVSPHHWQPRPR